MGTLVVFEAALEKSLAASNIPFAACKPPSAASNCPLVPRLAPNIARHYTRVAGRHIAFAVLYVNVFSNLLKRLFNYS